MTVILIILILNIFGLTAGLLIPCRIRRRFFASHGEMPPGNIYLVLFQSLILIIIAALSFRIRFFLKHPLGFMIPIYLYTAFLVISVKTVYHQVMGKFDNDPDARYAALSVSLLSYSIFAAPIITIIVLISHFMEKRRFLRSITED